MAVLKNQPWINKPQTAVISGRVPFKYQIMTIGGVPPLINKHWFINPGLTLYNVNVVVYI